MQPIIVSRASVQSLFLTVKAFGQPISTATGFIVMKDQKPYLLTNWHVVSGRHPETGNVLDEETSAIPDSLAIRHCIGETEASPEWLDYEEPLFDTEGTPRWLEHARQGRKVDIVALPLTNYSGAQIMPHELDEPDPKIRTDVTDWLYVVGFPFGKTGGASLAIWTRGSIATHLRLDFDDKPCFLLDARTRKGQSGAPVIAYGMRGNFVPLSNGVTTMLDSPFGHLVGIYSGRIDDTSDLGIVWRVDAMREILDTGVIGDGGGP